MSNNMTHHYDLYAIGNALVSIAARQPMQVGVEQQVGFDAQVLVQGTLLKHHANAARRYQSLRHFPDRPQLPSGYFGMFVVAYVPPLWYRVMDRRLIDAVGGDVDRINFQPGQKQRLMRKYGLR